MIRLHRIAPDVRTLGPGVRFGVWVQGCLRACPGCMTPESWDMNGGFEMDEAELARRMLAFDFEGLTISGGEPMLQSAALCALIARLREARDVGVILYTGWTMEELRTLANPESERLLGMVDLLIDGAYVASMDDGGALRGSSNQRAWHLTDRYRGAMEGAFGAPGGRKRQVHIDDQGMFLIGLRENGTKE